jgi:D-alanine-D-alanine ligase
MHIGLTYDLRDDYADSGLPPEALAEFDSRATIDALADAITTAGHVVDRIGNARALCMRLVAGGRWDLVFNIAEGLHGRAREAQVPALLELYDIPYTASDPLVCALTLDKGLAKRVVRDAGLNTPAFATVLSGADLAALGLNYPLFAKPLAEGTGKGIDRQSCITDSRQLTRVCRALLARYRQPVLVEEFLPGREFTVGILGTGKAARVIGTLEIICNNPEADAIYSYEMKERCEEFITYRPPARSGLIDDVELLALNAHRALECRDVSRVDIRIDAAGLPSFIEINPLPGLHPSHSDLPMIATSVGMSYVTLIGSIVDSAVKRQACSSNPHPVAASAPAR